MKTNNLRITVVIALLTLVISLVLTSCNVNKPDNKDNATINIAVLNGTTGFSIAPLYTSMRDGKIDSYANIDFYASADLVSPLVINGSVDIAAVPTNLAAVLYNKTGGAVRVLAVNTLGVLYLVENGNSVNTLDDLRGKTVYLPGQGSNPQYVLSALLDAAGLTSSVTLDYTYASPDELTTALAAGKASIGVLPEPKVSAALANNTSLRVALDFTSIWKSVTGTELVQGCLIARSEFVDAHPTLIAKFIKDYENSVATINTDPKAAAELIVSANLAPNVSLVTAALPRCNITCFTGDDMETALTAYWTALYKLVPASVGSKVPDTGIFGK